MATQQSKPDPRPTLRESFRQQSRWRRLVLIGGALFLGVGVVLKAMEAFGDEDAPEPYERVSAPSGQEQGFTPGATDEPGSVVIFKGEGAATTEEEDGMWSSFFFFGGFSFFVGFCVGYALRAFFKISAITLGVILLVIFGLNYAGLVQVDWSAIEDVYDNVVTKVREESEQFQTFLTGSLSSTGLGALGLFTGFRRK